MKTCSHCGAPNNDKDSFCMECGAPLNAAPAQGGAPAQGPSQPHGGYQPQGGPQRPMQGQPQQPQQPQQRNAYQQQAPGQQAPRGNYQSQGTSQSAPGQQRGYQQARPQQPQQPQRPQQQQQRPQQQAADFINRWKPEAPASLSQYVSDRIYQPFTRPYLTIPTYYRNFQSAISTCLREKYFTTSGRATRSEYWYFALFVLLVGLAVLFVLFLFNLIFANIGGGHSSSYSASRMLGGMVGSSILSMIFVFVFTCAVIIPSFTVTIRRLHDSGKSELFFIFGVIPFVGPLILAGLLLLDSDPFDNQYGKAPEEETK